MIGRISISILLGLSFLLAAGQDNQVSIGRIAEMANIPSPYNLRDWKQVAINYDRFVFDASQTGTYLPFVQFKAQGNNYPERSFFSLPSYVGSNSPESGEAINILPALVGASLVGVDKSSQDGKNYVLMAQDFFNKKNGENLYLNSNSAKSGNDWWYDMMPNVFFYQLYDLYPDMGGEADFQFQAVADNMLEALKAMDGSATPWSQPSMNYRAWKFETMEPLIGGVPEPESAGSFSWLLYHAYSVLGDEKYRIGAEWAMEYLSSLSSNPSYELQLPYGTYIAARMNAEIGTDYDVEKMLNWSFDRGSLRGWGTIADTWNGIDVHGLVGESETNTDYAFQLNGVQQAAALVPMIRYDKRFARTIAKWVLNLANSNRLFYHSFLPSSLQDATDWSEANDPLKVVGYEALKEVNGGLSPFSTGDAVGGGWAATNLALYGTSSIGYLGAIISETEVDKILKIDLLKTDFYHDEAYPSYLYYNPYVEEKTITLFVGSEAKDVYDPVREDYLIKNVFGSVAISIPADEVIMPVIAPAGGQRTFDKNKMLINGVVVDYDQHQSSFEAPFRIKAVAADKERYTVDKIVNIYSTVDFTGEASALNYTWTLNGSLLESIDSILTFTPDQIGIYQVMLVVEGSETFKDTAYTQFEVVEAIEEPPVIVELILDSKYGNPGEVIGLQCIATDPNGGDLVYTWTAEGNGAVVQNGAEAEWTLPEQEGSFEVSVTVTDTTDLSSLASKGVLVKNFSEDGGNLIAYYPLAGNGNDLSGNELNGNLVGGVSNSGFDGMPSEAHFFNGTTHYMEVPSTSKLNLTEAITISLWLNPDNLPDRESFLISHGSWQNRWKASIIPEKKIRWTVNTSSGISDLDSETLLTTDTFRQVSMTYDGQYMILYLDGELEAFSEMEGQLRTTGIPLLLAQSLPGEQAYNFRGTLDEVKIFDYAITPEAAKLLYEIGEVSGVYDAPLEKQSFFDIYPNPVEDKVEVIAHESEQVYLLTIYNTVGELVLSQKIKGNKSLSLSRIPRGVYFLNFTQEGRLMETKRIIKN